MVVFYERILYFIAFSFVGWICETIYCTVLNKKLAYRGFLNEPLCPVYGFGGLIVVYLLAPFQNELLLLFIMGVFSTMTLEFFTSLILEKLFHTRWWDYSEHRLNIDGRCCLSYGLMFGGLSILAVYYIYPPFSKAVTSIPGDVKPLLALSLLALFLADCILTFGTLLKFNGMLKALHANRARMNSYMESLDARGAGVREKITAFREGRIRMQELRENAKEYMTDEDMEMIEIISDKHERFKLAGNLAKAQMKRLALAFPQRKYTKYRIERDEFDDSMPD